MGIPVGELDLPTIDLTIHDSRDVRLSEFARVGAEHWLARCPLGFLLTRHEDVVAVLRDRRFYSAVTRIAQMQGVKDPEWQNSQRKTIQSAEGADHARLRGLLATAFTPKAVDRLRPFMRELAERLVAPVAASGRCELVHDLCEPYPVQVICELLGAPAADWELFSSWATDILRVADGKLAEDMPVILTAQREMDLYVRGLIASRRGRSGDDLLSALVAALDAENRVSSDELVRVVESVLLGGSGTTRNQLACTVFALLAEHPEQWAILRADPGLAPRAVEESMRHLGAVRATGRYASEDIEYRGVLFPKGTLVFPSFLAGNFDPQAWDEPERFDITIERRRSQLTFGTGSHGCLGIWLARAELQEALTTLVRLLPDPALDGVVTWKAHTDAVWGPLELPLRFTPTPVGALSDSGRMEQR